LNRIWGKKLDILVAGLIENVPGSTKNCPNRPGPSHGHQHRMPRRIIVEHPQLFITTPMSPKPQTIAAPARLYTYSNDAVSSETIARSEPQRAKGGGKKPGIEVLASAASTAIGARGFHK
jgi:hypothetical protein